HGHSGSEPDLPDSWRSLVFTAARKRVCTRAAQASLSASRTAPARGCVMLIDSHCHLEYEGLVEDQQGVLARAREAGIGGFLNISTRQREWRNVIGTAERENDVWASVGIHPHEADAHADLGVASLLEAAEHPKVIAIGETGLD